MGVYLTGKFASAVIGPTTLTGKGGWDAFVGKLDRSGAFHWAVSAGGTGDDEGWAVAADGAGNTYVTGKFEGPAVFGSTTLPKGGMFVWRIPASP